MDRATKIRYVYAALRQEAGGRLAAHEVLRSAVQLVARHEPIIAGGTASGRPQFAALTVDHTFADGGRLMRQEARRLRIFTGEDAHDSHWHRNKA